MRKLATALVALCGLVLMTIGIWGAQPVPHQVFPRLLGGPVLWIGGIMLLMASPAVYALTPERETRE